MQLTYQGKPNMESEQYFNHILKYVTSNLHFLKLFLSDCKYRLKLFSLLEDFKYKTK